MHTPFFSLKIKAFKVIFEKFLLPQFFFSDPNNLCQDLFLPS